MSQLEYSAYPQVYGIEEELQIEKRYAGEAPITVEAGELQTALADYQHIAANVVPPLRYEKLHEHVYRKFNAAGDKTYIDCLNLERATAECSSVRQAVVRSRGVEQFAAGIAQCLLDRDPWAEEIVYRRRAGLFSDMVGTQDSIYAPVPPNVDRPQHVRRVTDMLSALAITRPYMTGAGAYRNGQFFFSQKLAYLKDYWAGNILEATPVMARGDRYEVRENDINICDAAAMMRLGGTAIASAVAQTKQFEKFEAAIAGILQGKGKYTGWAGSFNKPALNPDGSFDTRGNGHLLGAVDFHLQLIDAFTSRFMRHEAGEQPQELLDIAERMGSYALTMHHVLHNRVPASILLPQSDWAVKLGHDGNGELDYDTIYTCKVDGKLVTDKTGLAFDLRDAGVFEGGISQTEVDQAYFTAPTDTRAAVRGAVIENYHAADVRWGYLLLFRDSPDGSAPPTSFYFDMEDPRQSTLSDEQRRLLQQARRRCD